MATALCALAAGALIITGACVLVARSFLMGQADQQLRAYAGGLISRPFAASPVYGLAPGAPSASLLHWEHGSRKPRHLMEEAIFRQARS